MNYVQIVKNDLLHILAPSLCPACNDLIEYASQSLCSSCIATIATAPYPEELFEELLTKFEGGEICIEHIGALFDFEKGGSVQRVIHSIKYHGNRQLARRLGGELIESLSQFPEFGRLDSVVGVPLHSARMRVRGYNQADEIARGVSDVVGIPHLKNALARQQNTVSQTTLGMASRYFNVRNAFRIAVDECVDQHVLLVDDVFTTGATLNACAEALLNSGAASVHAAVIARDVPTKEQRQSSYEQFFNY